MQPIYDNSGVNYAVTRCTDPQIAQQLYAELHGATRIVNIGAGTGSYERYAEQCLPLSKCET
ncbi:MAG TPA: hypothetical protein P5121_34875 [Caldilineaceae bacterium]|nr:hypothetical protein [Caldilineaceae bacterium]